MKENKYDDNIFFQKYSQMSRSQKGLAGAGEWETLKKMLPDFKGKRVLDFPGFECLHPRPTPLLDCQVSFGDAVAADNFCALAGELVLDDCFGAAI